MKTLHVTLAHKWFDAIEAGKKIAEYRQRTPYWEKKLQIFRPGDAIIFHRGYTAQTITGTIKNIRIITGWDLPNQEYKYFNSPNETQFFEILFEKCLTF